MTMPVDAPLPGALGSPVDCPVGRLPVRCTERMNAIDRDILQGRAEVAMWGCLACAQPWFVAGSAWGWLWAAAAVVACMLARMAGRRM